MNGAQVFPVISICILVFCAYLVYLISKAQNGSQIERYWLLFVITVSVELISFIYCK